MPETVPGTERGYQHFISTARKLSVKEFHQCWIHHHGMIMDELALLLVICNDAVWDEADSYNSKVF